jgi:hypothetical protein
MSYLDSDWITGAYNRIWKSCEGHIVQQAGYMYLPTHLTPDPVFVRDEYTELWTYLEKARIQDRSRCGGLVILGQPGIGESVQLRENKI